jgi:hypothetical protein
VSIIEELLGRKSSGSGLETAITALGIRDADHVAPQILKRFSLTSLTSGGRLVGILRSQTHAMEFFYILFKNNDLYTFCIDSNIDSKH